MINFEKAKEEFINFANKYDLTEKEIERKKFHSLRVMELSTKIAESLKLSKEDVELATLIGLLHDIARFDQWKEFKTFSDFKSFDHGDRAVEILKNNNYIRNYIEDDSFDNLIYIAIRNHNKFKIEDGLSERELMFSKIIKDADKIDIFYEGTILFYDTKECVNEIQTCRLSEICYTEFKSKELINRKYVQNKLDSMINLISFVFDLNFDFSRKYLYEKKYIDMIFARFDFSLSLDKYKILELQNDANNFLKE